MMSDPHIDNPWLAERAREVRANIDAFQRDVQPLAYLQIGWRPPDGGWSIGQVVEHLIINDESYLQLFDRMLARKPERAWRGEWKPSLIGGLLTRSLMPDSKRKVTTPAIWRPGPQPRANVVEEYIQSQERMLEALRKADGHDLRGTKLSSPAMKLMRMNLGDAFLTLVVHTQRHLKQIERIRQRAEFPR